MGGYWSLALITFMTDIESSLVSKMLLTNVEIDEKEKSDGVGRGRCCSWSWYLTGVVVDTWENLTVSQGDQAGQEKVSFLFPI